MAATGQLDDHGYHRLVNPHSTHKYGMVLIQGDWTEGAFIEVDINGRFRITTSRLALDAWGGAGIIPMSPAILITIHRELGKPEAYRVSTSDMDPKEAYQWMKARPFKSPMLTPAMQMAIYHHEDTQVTNTVIRGSQDLELIPTQLLHMGYDEGSSSSAFKEVHDVMDDILKGLPESPWVTVNKSDLPNGMVPVHCSVKKAITDPNRDIMAPLPLNLPFQLRHFSNVKGYLPKLQTPDLNSELEPDRDYTDDVLSIVQENSINSLKVAGTVQQHVHVALQVTEELYKSADHSNRHLLNQLQSCMASLSVYNTGATELSMSSLGQVSTHRMERFLEESPIKDSPEQVQAVREHLSARFCKETELFDLRHISWMKPQKDAQVQSVDEDAVLASQVGTDMDARDRRKSSLRPHKDATDELH